MARDVEELILNNIDLVYYVVNRMKLGYNTDVVSEGMLALVEAAQNFDETKGTQFSTYAVSYIKGRIKTYLTLRTSVVKPSRVNGKYAEIETVQSDSEVNEIEDVSKNIESALIVRDFMQRLTAKERIVANGLMQDKTQKQIGKELNICQTQVCKMIRIIRYKYMTYQYESRLTQ